MTTKRELEKELKALKKYYEGEDFTWIRLHKEPKELFSEAIIRQGKHLEKRTGIKVTFPHEL